MYKEDNAMSTDNKDNKILDLESLENVAGGTLAQPETNEPALRPNEANRQQPVSGLRDTGIWVR